MKCEELIEEQKAYQCEILESLPAPTVHQETSAERSIDPNVGLQRQRLFIALVQTRALFHDCERVAKLRPAESYSALAPNIVLAAFEFPIDDIDEDVAKHAEYFVRFFVDGASG